MDYFFTDTEVERGRTYEYRIDSGLNEAALVWDEKHYDVSNVLSFTVPFAADPDPDPDPRPGTAPEPGSVVLLEVSGARVTQEGNVVMLGNNIRMAVAEACSGLRMLTAFIIVAAFVAYMVKRPRWQKGVLLASSTVIVSPSVTLTTFIFLTICA